MSRIAKITTIVLVCGITLSAAAYFLRDTAVAGVVMNKVNTYRLNQGLVGWWTFDGTDLNFQTNRVTDRSGQGNYGEMVNMSTSSSRVAGKVGQALRFDGVNDRVDLSAGLPTVNDFTISGWMKLETGATPGNHYALFNCGSCSSDTRIMPHVNEGGYLTVNGTLSPSMNGLTVNEWAFIVVTRNGSTANYYRDGNLETSWSSGSTALDLADSNIGADFLSYYVRGTIDDVRIWSRALSAQEVKLLYTSTAGSKMNTSRNTIPGSTLQTGLVGLWSFDGPDLTDKVYDRSGQGNHGYFNGGATSSAKVAGKVGQALSFRVGLDEVDVGSAASLDNIAAQGGGGMTISAWIRPTQGMVTNGAIATKGYGGSNGWSFRLIENSGSYGLRFSSSFDGGTDIDTWSNYGTIALNAWQHVVVTWDGSTNANNLYTYLNSIDITDNRTNGVGNRDSDAAQRAFIGDGSFSGTIDDVRVYNRALSAGEVKDLYNATVGTKVNHSQNSVPGSTLQQGLVGLWSFNGPDLNSRTNTAYDRSGQGNNGEMVNMSTSTSRVPGKVGQALQFDGVDDEIDAPLTGLIPASGSTNFSWSFWMRTQDANQVQPIGWSAYRWCEINYTAGKIGCSVDSDFGNGGTESTTTINDNAWHHVVFTHSNASVQNLYIDGVLEDSAGETISTLNPSTDLIIGYREFGSYFSGILDEVRVYNRVLTPAEVKLLYNLGR